MTVVLANGCFDVFHAGHLAHLKEARMMGDKLIVALTMDEYVNKREGMPINTWTDRADLLRELRCVDEVFCTRSAVEAIYDVKPDIFVKGIDYAGGDKFTEDIAGACKAVGASIAYTTSMKRSAEEIIRKAIGG